MTAYLNSLFFLQSILAFLFAVNANKQPFNFEKLPSIPKLTAPVWSLATLNEDKTTNMNLVTFASAVSIFPKPLWSLSLYKGTLSHANFSREGHGVLQLLQERQAHLITLLGKTSGKQVNKMERLTDMIETILPFSKVDDSFPGSEEKNDKRDNNISLLGGCKTVIELWRTELPCVDAGDHEIFFCSVNAYRNTGHMTSTTEDVDEEGEALTTGYLRQRGLL